MNNRKGIINKILFFDFIGMIFCIFKSFSYYEYSFWLLPTVYTFLFFITYVNRKLSSRNIGALVLNITMSIRYVAIPVIYYSTNELSRFAKNYNNLGSAIYLMIYEMIVLMLVLEISARKYYKKEKNMKTKKQPLLHLQYGKLLAIGISIIVLGIGVFYKNLGAGFRVITTGKLEQSINFVNNNFIDILWETLTTWIYVYLTMREAEKYESDHRNIHTTLVIVYTFIFILITFIQSVAFSRWYTIISAISAIACLFKMFPQSKKKILLSIGIPTIILLILITSYKNAGFNIGETKFSDSISDIFSSSNFDSYFSGPVNVNNAIGVKNNYKNLGMKTIINDMLNNMPIVNHYMDITQTSVYAYNASIGRIWNGVGDQIIPLLGQSIIYFGYIFAPLMGVITILIVRKFDYLFKKNSSYMMYVYAFIAVWMAVEPMMLNLTITINWFYIRIIPFALIFMITNKISYKKYLEKDYKKNE